MVLKIVPIFIPHYGCPHACVFCNQTRITGQCSIPDPAAVNDIIEEYLQTIPLSRERQVEVAFYGGSFTALEPELQEAYLRVVQPWLREGAVDSVRVSTRPDAISSGILDLLARYGVRVIELGVQSLDAEVLRQSGRGYTPHEVWNAVRLIKDRSFCLGIQLMIGLPGDTREKDLATARQVVEMKPAIARLYPALVIKGTRLAEMYENGAYRPLGLEAAVNISADMFMILENAGIRVIRMGLQPTEELMNGDSLQAGPFHPAFGELVESEVFWRQAQTAIMASGCLSAESLRIFVNEKDVSKMTGLRGRNRKRLQEFLAGEVNIKGINSTGRNWVGIGRVEHREPQFILSREQFVSDLLKM